MAKEKTAYLKLLAPPEKTKPLPHEVAARRKRAERRLVFIVLVLLALCGTYLLLKNETYSHARVVENYENGISDSSNYVQFGDGIVRYNRDGVSYLNCKNEELWIHPAQIKNPIIEMREGAFAVADSGGNSILVFTENGLKGEIETTLPIEKISVSNQGIVSAILRDGSAPKIMTYDAVGNILVEQQATMSNTGYPVALELSEDGKVLAVSYLYTKGITLDSRVVHYNFGEKGKEKADNKVAEDQFDNEIMAELFFLSGGRTVVVGDSSFVIYDGGDTPQKRKEVEIHQEIKSVFHSEKYIGFVLLNQEKSGYELHIYNRSGDFVVSRDFTGEYAHAKFIGDEVVLYDGSRCCIMTVMGVEKYQGMLEQDILEIFRAAGLNRYYVMNVNELDIVCLTK